MRKITLDYYQDPSHGWVRIDLQKLIDLGIHDKISHYSYVRNRHAYLEEDNDLALLYNTCDNRGIVINLRDHHTNKSSKIRSYESYGRYLKKHNELLNLWNT